jgi:hypothetical protein
MARLRFKNLPVGEFGSLLLAIELRIAAAQFTFRGEASSLRPFVGAGDVQ